MDTKTRTSNLPAIAFALAALTATLPFPALARGEPASEAVPYGDLNLASEAGVKALDRRLDRAVERVCGAPPVRSLATHRQVAECREQAWQAIQDDRAIAIARATGRTNGQEWAERSPRNQSRVTLAE